MEGLVPFPESNVTSIGVTVRFQKSQNGPGQAPDTASALRRCFVGAFPSLSFFERAPCQMESNRCHRCVQGANLLQNGPGNVPERSSQPARFLNPGSSMTAQTPPVEGQTLDPCDAGFCRGLNRICLDM